MVFLSTTAWYTTTVVVLSFCHQGQITKVLNMKPPEVRKLWEFFCLKLTDLNYMNLYVGRGTTKIKVLEGDEIFN